MKGIARLAFGLVFGISYLFLMSALTPVSC